MLGQPHSRAKPSTQTLSTATPPTARPFDHGQERGASAPWRSAMAITRNSVLSGWRPDLGVAAGGWGATSSAGGGGMGGWKMAVGPPSRHPLRPAAPWGGGPPPPGGPPAG